MSKPRSQADVCTVAKQHNKNNVAKCEASRNVLVKKHNANTNCTIGMPIVILKMGRKWTFFRQRTLRPLRLCG
jgi:hypothetical protein